MNRLSLILGLCVATALLPVPAGAGAGGLWIYEIGAPDLGTAAGRAALAMPPPPTAILPA